LRITERKAVRPEIGRSALQTVLGPFRTWMHRSLESITDEARLRRLILRLLQSGLPRYAQVRHGPLEYGKDITALLEIDDALVLSPLPSEMWDIDTKKWRESKDELDEIFQVPLESPQLPELPQRIEGVLVTNGHANPHVEPRMTGWFKEQRETHGREIGEYRGVVRVPRRVFQRLLPDGPTPERCVEAYYLQRTRFESIAERKLRRRQLTEDGNVEISGRDLR